MTRSSFDHDPKFHSPISAGQILRAERELRGWSQAKVAEAVGTSVRTVIRWEQDQMLPVPYYREKLSALFGKNARELGFLAPLPSSEPFAPLPLPPEALIDPAIPPLSEARAPLVGREELLATLTARLRNAPPGEVLALYGLPGVGKTELASVLAHDAGLRSSYSAGVLWARVGKQPDVPGLLSRWGNLLGLSSLETARFSSPEDWALAIRTQIGARRFLLVLDDVWTLSEAAALQVGGEGCATLLTTRFPQLAWHLSQQGSVPVRELEADESLLLLRQLAPVAVAQEEERARELVELVGGLPLALLLAGNFLRTQAYSGQPRRIRQAIERLRAVETRLHLQEPWAPALRTPSLADAPRVSLHTLIAASEQQLKPRTREVLVALSVFPAKPNTFSEAAALAVCADGPEVLDELSDAGLLESYAPDRYGLHQTIADYARVQRRERGPSERFLHYMAEYVRQHEQDYAGLEQESANILAALRQASEQPGQQEVLARTGNAFAAFLVIHGSYEEANELLRRVCQAASEVSDEQGLARALSQLGGIALNRGEYTLAREHLQQGLALIPTSRNPALRSRLLRILGLVEASQGDIVLAELHLQEALALARQQPDRELLYQVLRSAGAIAAEQAKFAQAEASFQEALVLARETGKAELICPLLANLGSIKANRGHYAEGEALIAEALTIVPQIGSQSTTLLLLQHLGRIEMQQGKYDQAREPFEKMLEQARAIRHQTFTVSALSCLADFWTKQGEYALASRYLEEGLVAARAIGSPWRLAKMLDSWGELCLQQGNIAAADAAFREMYELSEQNSQADEAGALFGLARVALAQHQEPEARQLGQASLALFQALDHYQAAEVEAWLAAHKGEETDKNEI